MGGGYFSKTESDNRYITRDPINGGVPMIHVDGPDYSYLNGLYGTSGTSDITYYRNLLKWLCSYGASLDASNTGMVFTGNARPNSQGWYSVQIYSVKDLQDGLPRYSSGIINNLNTIWEFGTIVFDYKCNEIYRSDTVDALLNSKWSKGDAVTGAVFN